MGGPGNDHLTDAQDANFVQGAGHDLVAIGPNEGDFVDGGTGGDGLGFVTDDGVTVDLAAGTITDPATATVLSIDSVTDTSGPDALYGSAASEFLSGEDGDDYIDGREGTDSADAGNGYDGCVNVESASNCEY